MAVVEENQAVLPENVAGIKQPFDLVARSSKNGRVETGKEIIPKEDELASKPDEVMELAL